MKGSADRSDPGTQPPFLIITAVQSLLITLKVCRAPRSPVMLRAIRESDRKIRRFWQKKKNSTFIKKKKKLKGWREGGRRQSSVAALLVWFLFLYLVHDEVGTLFTIKNAECTPFFTSEVFSKMLMVAKRCSSCFFFLLRLCCLLSSERFVCRSAVALTFLNHSVLPAPQLVCLKQ